ncbi:MAG: hypothetical protein LC667_15905, partial [Thioalkalivibrio sp.]|nr:hypothetical protein [Thioalkalivibrio sp.]
MLTVIVNTKRGVLDWLAPARPFWYVAERDEARRMAVYSKDVACDEVDGPSGHQFRRWLDRLFTGRERISWRLLMLADENAVADPANRGWFRFADRAAEGLTERVVLAFSPETIPDRACRRRFEFVDTIDDAPTYVVRTHDPTLQGNVPEAKLTTALLIAALSQHHLFEKPTPRELYVPASQGGPHVRGIALRGDPALARDDAALSTIVADYRRSLERARDSLDDRPLTVGVGVDESPGATTRLEWTLPSGPK